MKKIIFIGEFLLSFPGGAEKSIYNELLRLKSDYDVIAYTFDTRYLKGTFKKDFDVINFGLKTTFKFSRFISLYYLNKRSIMQKLNEIKKELKSCEYIITQGLVAPIVAEFCIKEKIPYHYYIRDEHQVNIFNNYNTGYWWILKEIKDIVEFISIHTFKKRNTIALKNADKIISNSKYIANILIDDFNLKSIVKYPEVKKFNFKVNKKDQKYITFIGGKNAMKGYDIVLKIAKRLPQYEFLIVGPYKKAYTKQNILFMPWQKDIGNVYKKTKLLLVPSRWNEAFGRVVIEANSLGIPVITSDKGGLPEANKNKLNIISIDHVDRWIKRIMQILSER